MTDKLYYEDGYLSSVIARVVDVKKSGIILDRTVFYPEGGGQPGDRGSFGPYRIVDTVKDEDGNPLHIIEGDKPPVGFEAELSLDWEHRLFYMTEHSAQHLVSALLFSNHHIGTVAVHQGESFFTIETNIGEIEESILLETEAEANAAIRENHSIVQREMSHEEAENLGMRRSIKVEGRVKVVFIDGIDAVACGGVHLKSTGEIGEIQYVGSEKIRGHVRTIWKCGKLSVDYRHRNRAIVQYLSSLLSSDSDNLIQSAERLVDDNAELRRTVRNLERKIAVFEIEKHKCSNSPIVFSSDVDIVAFEDVFDEDDSIVAFVVDGNGRFMFHGTGDLFNDLKTGLAAYSLRGGGREWFYRGSVKGPVNSVLEEAQRLLNG